MGQYKCQHWRAQWCDSPAGNSSKPSVAVAYLHAALKLVHCTDNISVRAGHKAERQHRRNYHFRSAIAQAA